MTRSAVTLLVVLALTAACGSGGGGEDLGAGSRDVPPHVDFPDGGVTVDAGETPPEDVPTVVDTVVAEDVVEESCPMVGDRRCGEGESVQECREGRWVTIQVCATGEICALGRCVPQPTCEPGEILGCASETQLNVCNETGQSYEPEDCPAGKYCVQGECGDELCAPYERKCQDTETVLYCNEDGSGWGDPEPCGEGSVCRDGACVSGCEDAIKLGSYIGLRVLDARPGQLPDPMTDPMPFEVPHSVVISNPGLVEAVIQFESELDIPIDVPNPVVPPQQARAFVMPRHDIDGTEKSFKSIHITSSMPVNAYQFNPLNNESVYSNDGSLLLPANTLGREYIVTSWPSGVPIDMLGAPAQSGYFTIVAATMGVTTTVSVTALGRHDGQRRRNDRRDDGRRDPAVRAAALRGPQPPGRAGESADLHDPRPDGHDRGGELPHRGLRRPRGGSHRLQRGRGQLLRRSPRRAAHPGAGLAQRGHLRQGAAAQRLGRDGHLAGLLRRRRQPDLHHPLDRRPRRHHARLRRVGRGEDRGLLRGRGHRRGHGRAVRREPAADGSGRGRPRHGPVGPGGPVPAASTGSWSPTATSTTS